MSTDPLETKFAGFRASTVMPGPGAPHARATVQRQRRRVAVVGAAVAVLVILGAGAVLAGTSQRPERLIPATAPSTESPTSAPTPTDDTWKQTIRNARMDLRPETEANCGGPVVNFRDGKAKAAYEGFNKNYTVIDYNMLRADIDRDGRQDYLVTLGCDYGDDPDRDECDPRLSKESCEFGKKQRIITQLFVLRGEPDNLTAIDGIHVGSYALPPSEVSVDDNGVITIASMRSNPRYIYVWGYRNGRMAVLSRKQVSATPSASPSR